jgi:putative lipoic acid-binding regulatory protein
MSEDSPLQFPTDFPIKVMGRTDGDLRPATREIVERHFGAVAQEHIAERISSDGNFLSLTYLVRAHSREQLDTLYRELTACKAVLMAL